MGIGFVSEDRKTEGIIPDLPIRENVSITILDVLKQKLHLNKKEEFKRVQDISKRVQLKAPSLEIVPSKLSGGNQQKVILARWLADQKIKVLIVDEPTRGIDVGAKREIYSILDELAKQGTAIIMMSSEMNEILNFCDRIYVMCDGEITGEFSHDEATQEKLFRKSVKLGA